MKLIQRTNCGAGVHRSGWPVVEAALQKVADDDGILCDITLEQSFLFGNGPKQPHTEPFVGIAHFPHIVDMTYPLDRVRDSAWTLHNNLSFKRSLPFMRGGISLCESLAAFWEGQIDKPFIALKHPTLTDVPQWSWDKFAAQPTMIQLGSHIRNTRAIFHQPPKKGWRYGRIVSQSSYYRKRDAELEAMLGPGCNHQVQDWPRVDNDTYDRAMAASVVISATCGLAACNVIVESIARQAPIIVERRPETEEYLGVDYCLYLGETSALRLGEADLKQASEQLALRKGPWLEPAFFAERVLEFCENME